MTVCAAHIRPVSACAHRAVGGDGAVLGKTRSVLTSTVVHWEEMMRVHLIVTEF